MEMKKIIYYFFVFGIMSTMPFVVFAKNIGVAVDQTAIVFDADAGEVQEFVVKVKNISDEEQKIDVDTMNYVLGDNNAITLSSDVAEGGIKDWISSQDKNIVLAPGEADEVVFSVNAPDNVSVGSHHGAVLFRVTPNNDDTVKVQGQIGVHVLVNVKGDTHASGQINSFDIPLLTSGSVDYVAEFENTGNIHYVPYGEVKVYNVFTKNEQKYEYDKHFVFPGKKFTFSHVEQIPSLFGLYRAQATFVDGEGATRTKVDYTMGYFFPLIFIGVVGGLLIVLRLLFKKRRDKKEVKKTSTTPSRKTVINKTKKRQKEVTHEKQTNSANADEEVHEEKNSEISVNKDEDKQKINVVINDK